MINKQNILIWKDAEAVSKAAAYFFIKSGKESIAKTGCFTVALSGGNTPKRLYQILATPEFRDHIDWKHVFICWSDERFVPHTHDDSNYKMAKENLLDHIAIPKKNILAVPTKGSPEKCAAQYEQAIKNVLGKKLSVDLTLLGMGDDGHTASLFPGTDILHEKRKLVKEVWVADKQTWRISFTYPLINRSKEILFLISGAAKAPVLKKMVQSSKSTPSFPVQGVSPKTGNLLVLADEAAYPF